MTLGHNVIDIPMTTASSSATTGALTIGGGLGVAADLYVGDDTYLITDSAVLGFGADKDTLLTHTDGTGLTLNSTNKLCFNDASQFVQGSSATVLSIGATDEIDLTATAIDINGTCDISGTFSLGGTNMTATAAELNLLDGGTSVGSSITVADADGFVVNDGGTMKTIPATDITTYVGGGDLSFGGDTFGADKTIGSNDTYALSFETDGNVAMKIDTAGIITKPLQPAFLATQASSQTDIAVNSTITLEIDTEVFDQNADFDTSTYTFTAPVTGRYLLHAECRLNSIDSVVANLADTLTLSTSNRGYSTYLYPYKVLNEDTSWSFQNTCITDMDASDTAVCQLWIWGGTTQSDTATNTATSFSGYLLG
jgi:hypothetical protein